MKLFWKFFLVIFVLAYVAVLAVVTALFGAPFLEVSPWYAVYSVLAFTLIIVLFNIGIAVLLRLLPLRYFAPQIRLFHPRKNDRKFFRKLGIKRWKIIVPDILSILKIFDKSKLKNTGDTEYLFKYLCEMGWAEAVHIVAFFAGYAAIFIPIGWLFTGHLGLSPISGEYIIWGVYHALIFVLPLAILNSFINILPICVQRYNRPVLMKLYERALKNRHIKESNNQKNADSNI
ncbi:MAG: hypothetical protein FWE03_00985 [Firmicutes bacterium]|nr:hypothetical protein [Bacillota bacterium]